MHVCCDWACLRGARLGVGGELINAFSKPASVYLFQDTCIEAFGLYVSLVVAERC